MQTSFECFEIVEKMIEIGNPNSITDAGVGALCIRTAVLGAFMNVKVNMKDLKDEKWKEDILLKATNIYIDTVQKDQTIFENVNFKIS